MRDLHIEYKFEKDYNPVYINGAYGGFGPHNEMFIHFFLERKPIPYSEILNISDDPAEKPKSEVSAPENFNDIVIRYVSSGVAMNVDTAISVYNWLGTHLKPYLEKNNEKEEENE